LEDGKKLNTRHYSIDLTGSKANQIKIGTRVPIAVSSSSSSSSSESNQQYQYLDVGTSISAQLLSHHGDEELRVFGDISSLDTAAGPEISARLLPVVRQIKIEGSTALVIGKPVIIGSADDPNSKRSFQLEVTVTKLR
jgi:type II secretory pathway component GspD/PulD (secretin)